jgi:Mrp family chromosome partitioning ATPase/capsular polysaccharide biosynthesis protein
MAIMAVSVVAAVGYAWLQGDEDLYQADVSILLQDPAVVTDGVSVASERFVASQVQIIGSQAVINEAVKILAESDPPVELTPAELLSEVGLINTGDSSLVILTVTADDAEEAVQKVNAMAAAYGNISRLQVTSAATAALGRIDAQIEAIEERQIELEAEIRDVRATEPGLATLEQQMRDGLATLGELQDQLASQGPTGEASASLRQAIDDVRTRMAVYQEALDVLPPGSALQSLIEEQDQLVARRGELVQRRDQILIDQDLARDAIALLTPAAAANQLPQGGAGRTLAVGIILGVLISAGLAYFLEIYRRRFVSRFEPETLFAVPLLADVPDFAAEGLATDLPVRDAPRSASAEAFRFAASAIESAMRATNAKSLLAVAPTVGHGKSTVVANVAISMATDENSVLVIDGDFGNQEATALLFGDSTPRSDGLTEIVESNRGVEKVVQRVPFEGSGKLHLLGRGRKSATAPNTLRSPRIREAFDVVRQQYDTVLVDAPPFLQVAYSSLLAAYVDALLIVINHETTVREAQELVERLRLVRTPVIGYVYNRAPMRPEMSESKGSMSDILGDKTPAHDLPLDVRR